MDISRQDIYGLQIVSIDLKIKNLIGSDFTLLNTAVSRYDNEDFPFVVMPVQAFGYAGFCDIDAELAMIAGFQ